MLKLNLKNRQVLAIAAAVVVYALFHSFSLPPIDYAAAAIIYQQANEIPACGSTGMERSCQMDYPQISTGG